MGRVEGKVVFITGVARGQGRAHALRLASEGADIIGIDICEDIDSNKYPLSTAADLEETARLVESYDRRAVLTIADVRDRSALSSAVADGVAQLGRLDAVIAQAGICNFGETDPQAFFDSVQVNFSGVVNAIEAALPHLESGASIVATGSLGAMIPGATDKPERGTGGIGYSFAKRTVASLVHDLAFVLAAKQIRVNAVHPTNTNTDLLHNHLMYKAFRPDLDDPTREDAEPFFANFNAMPVGWVEPEDIAAAALFLISDEARYVTGLQMRVDAGCYVKNRPQQPYF